MSNAKTRDLMLGLGPQIPGIAESSGVKIVAGPYVNRKHIVVSVAEAETADAVDRFIVDSKLGQWNSVRVLPSLRIEQGMQELQAQTPIF